MTHQITVRKDNYVLMMNVEDNVAVEYCKKLVKKNSDITIHRANINPSVRLGLRK